MLATMALTVIADEAAVQQQVKNAISANSDLQNTVHNALAEMTSSTVHDRPQELRGEHGGVGGTRLSGEI